jgi:sulfhydrogenase subunit alpha
MKKIIKVDALSRVEGEGSLRVHIDDQGVGKVELGFYEPPRFFEGILRGRYFSEAPDLTARICGICPVAHQLTSVQAMENALGQEVSGSWRDLRRLIYCGEWIESHALHIFMLHTPDFLNYPDALAMAKDHPDVVEAGLRIKKLGNRIVSLVGGREIHPINIKVGGFYGLPNQDDLAGLGSELAWALDACQEMLAWLSDLPFPNYERDYLFVSLRAENEYPIDHAKRIVSSHGLDIPTSEFADHFQEEHLAYSTALHAKLRGHGQYLVGPMARFNLNYDLLSSSAKGAARKIGLEPSCSNPFKSVLIRGIELLYTCEEAHRLVKAYQPPERADLEIIPGPGQGSACTEAPRGMLHHSYSLDDSGVILQANIVTPTSQNQGAIEQDLHDVATQNQGLGELELTRLCETTVRNYDPCISCSTH